MHGGIHCRIAAADHDDPPPHRHRAEVARGAHLFDEIHCVHHAAQVLAFHRQCAHARETDREEDRIVLLAQRVEIHITPKRYAVL